MTFEDFDDEWSDPADWARMYRAFGLQVVPSVAPREDQTNWKRPCLAWKTFEDELVPDATNERWYGAHGEHRGRRQMGLITGRCSGGVFCVDLDTHKPNSGAAAWFAGIRAAFNNDMDFETPSQRTGGGGRQLLFRAPVGWSPPTFKTPIGIDIRGQGGFMVAPPSLHESGRHYEWEPGRAPWQVDVMDAPEGLIEAIDRLREEHARGAGQVRERTASSGATKDAFGLDIDDREEKLMRWVWGAVVDMRREAPIKPTQSEQDEVLRGLWQRYLSSTKTRLPITPDRDNAGGLELEGRGWSELGRKWRYAIAKWDKEVAAAAAVTFPRDAPPQEAAEGAPAQDASAERFAPMGFTGEVPPPRPWAYGNFLMYGAVSGIAAPPGVGKTTFSFQLGIAFGLDLAFGTWTPAVGGGGRAWLYNGEEPRDELDRRFMAACAEMGVIEAKAAARLAYNSGLSERLMLLRMDPKSGEITRSPDVDTIKARIVEHGFRLFIVDPLIEFHGVKEDTEGFHAVGAVLREIAHDCNCAVLFFHHTPKTANSDTAAGDMNAMRGGGPIIGVARFVGTMFSMTRKDAEDYGVPAAERTRYVRFDDAKANMAAMDGEPQWWARLGVSIQNAAGLRPSDNIGVLRYTRLNQTDGEQGAARALQRKTEIERVAREMMRVCAANGHTTPATAGSLDVVCRGLDAVAVGMSVNKAKDLVTSGLGAGVEIDGMRVVITTVPRGKLTVRKVHVEESKENER